MVRKAESSERVAIHSCMDLDFGGGPMNLWSADGDCSRGLIIIVTSSKDAVHKTCRIPGDNTQINLRKCAADCPGVRGGRGGSLAQGKLEITDTLCVGSP